MVLEERPQRRNRLRTEKALTSTLLLALALAKVGGVMVTRSESTINEEREEKVFVCLC